MVLEAKPSNSGGEGSQKRLDREIKEMVSMLTNHITELQPNKNKAGSGDEVRTDEDDDRGVRVITLAGNNTGATMRAGLGEMLEGQGFDHEMLGAYANSNCQAVNNSIMMNGSYTAEDPGVHIVISDLAEEHEQGHLMEEHEKTKEEKKKKKKKEDSKSKLKEHPSSDVHGEKTNEVEPQPSN
ncbi:hypothetical protein ACLOJK_032131 [Asimina triloba]